MTNLVISLRIAFREFQQVALRCSKINVHHPIDKEVDESAGEIL